MAGSLTVSRLVDFKDGGSDPVETNSSLLRYNVDLIRARSRKFWLEAGTGRLLCETSLMRVMQE